MSCSLALSSLHSHHLTSIIPPALVAFRQLSLLISPTAASLNQLKVGLGKNYSFCEAKEGKQGWKQNSLLLAALKYTPILENKHGSAN